MSVRKFGFLVVALAIATPTMVLAENAATAEADANDPNRMVCKKSQVTGSRLGKKKICMTAAQWEVQRQADREALERSQSGRWKGNSND